MGIAIGNSTTPSVAFEPVDPAPIEPAATTAQLDVTSASGFTAAPELSALPVTLDDELNYSLTVDGRTFTGNTLQLLVQEMAPDPLAALGVPPGTFSFPPVGPTFGGSITSADDMAQQPFSSGSDFFDPHPDTVAQTMELARSALAQGHEPVISLHALLLDEDKRLRPDASAILDGLIADYPDLMLKPGAVFEAVDEVFWNRLPGGASGTGGPERTRQAADDAIATLDLLRSKLPEARLAVNVCPEVWRADLNSSKFADGSSPADASVVPEFQRIMDRLQPGDVVCTDPYAWTTDPHDQAIKLQAAQEFNAFVREHHPELKTGLIPQGFLPIDLDKPADAWTEGEVERYGAFLDQMFTIAKDYDQTIVWGGVTAADGLSGMMKAPQAIKDLYQKWALELGGGATA